MKKILLFTMLMLLIMSLPAHAYRCYYKGVSRAGSGNVITGATISLFLAGTTTPAKLYDSSTNTTVAYSTTSSTTDGSFELWISRFDYDADQKFKFVITKSGYTSATYDNIDINSAVLGTYTITADTTVSTYIKPPYGVIYATSGAGHIVFLKWQDPGPVQVFTSDASVNVTGIVRPEWYGSDSTAMQSCFDASGSCILNDTSYNMGTTGLTVSSNNKVIEGIGNPVLYWSSSFTGTGITVTGDNLKMNNVGVSIPKLSGTASAYGMVIQGSNGKYNLLNVGSTGTGTYNGWNYGIRVVDTSNNFTNSSITASDVAIYITNGPARFDMVDSICDATNFGCVWSFTSKSVPLTYTNGSIKFTGVSGTEAGVITTSNTKLHFAGNVVSGFIVGAALSGTGSTTGNTFNVVSGGTGVRVLSSNGNYIAGNRITSDASPSTGIDMQYANYNVFIKANDVSTTTTLTNSSSAWSGDITTELRCSSSWTIGSTATDVSQTLSGIACTGASVGDPASGVHAGLNGVGDMLNCVVTATDTVACMYVNKGATKTPGAGTLRIKVNH